MRDKLQVDVPLTLVGEAPAVEQFDAVVVQALDTVSVQCLPGDIPSHIDVDISSLVDLTTGIFVRDLRAPAGVEILTDGDVPVVSITAQSQEIEEEPEAGEEAAEEAEGGETEAAAEDEREG